MTGPPTLPGLGVRLSDRTEPVHIIAEPGDRRSLCGIKDPLPVAAEKAVDAHVTGWNMPVCPDCAAVRARAG